MISLLISALVAAAGGVLVYLFRETIGAKLFPPAKPPAQQAADLQKKEDAPLVNPPTDQETKDALEKGKF